jgi:hypothetical protein
MAASRHARFEYALPQGVRPEELRPWALANLKMPSRRVKLAFSFAVMDFSGSESIVFVVIRDKGGTVFSARNAVLARVAVTRNRKKILAETEPFGRFLATPDSEWRETLARFCRGIGVDPSFLEKLNPIDQRGKRPTAEAESRSRETTARAPIPPHGEHPRPPIDPSAAPALPMPRSERRGEPKGYRAHSCTLRSPARYFSKTME